MPQAAAAVITKWIVGAFGVGKFAAAVIEIALTIGITKLSNSIAGRDDRNYRSAESREVNVRGSMQPRQLIYGQIRTAGHIVYYNVNGPNSKYLWYVIVVCGHQCEAIDDVFLDDRHAPWQTINPTTGEVSDVQFEGNDGKSKLYIWKHLGTAAQAADPMLIDNFPALWSSDHRASGVAYIVLRLELDDKVWPNGSPSLIEALVKGCRVYDQRKDSTNGGSGTHRINDATTWEWSPNWALCSADYFDDGTSES